MSFDYDLVIIGGSLTARRAAAQARRSGARVALVEPESTPLDVGTLLQHQAAMHLCQVAEQVDQTQVWGAAQPTTDIGQQLWQELLVWAELPKTIANSEVDGLSLSLLAAAGIDVIVGNGQFVAGSPTDRKRPKSPSRPPSTAVFLVNERRLRSRSYLLAIAAQQYDRPPTALTLPNARSIHTLWQQPWQQLPSRLLIWGNDPRGIELAQLFNRLGCQVALITRDRLLPDEDTETVAHLQSYLEAEGIAVFTQTSITQSKQLGEQVWVQAGDRALAANAFIVATMPAMDLSPLQLEAVGIGWQPEGVRVTSTLQTTHPQIYACGEALGGYALPHVADYEAEIALKNSLLGTTTRADYGQLPWSLMTSPSLTRIGLTEQQARRYYRDDDVVVLRQPLQSMNTAQIRQATTGWGKLILRRTGEVTGAHILGGNAEDWIGTIALAMQHRIPLHRIDRTTVGSATFSTLLARWQQQWQQHQATPPSAWKRWVGRFKL